MNKKSHSETREYVIPITPDYDCYDYFKARDPKRLKKLKTIHDNGEYLEFDELVRPKYEEELTSNKKRLIRKTAKVPCLKDFYPNSYEYEFIDIGLQDVEVNKIVGVTSSRTDDYNEDWTPVNEDDERWQYQINLIKSNQPMQPVPLIKMPNGEYVGNSDGSHRIAAAHVMGLNTIQANVSVMVPTDLNIDEKWKEYASEKINKLNEMSEEYKQLNREIPNLIFEDPERYEKESERLYELGDQISELDKELLEEEKEFKVNILNNLS